MSIALNLNSLFTETVTYNFVDTGSVTELDTGAITTGETITEGITELVDQAQKFGFSREKFLNWMSSISNEFLLMQTIEYWLLAYASKTVTDSWNEDYSPDAWLIESFSLKSANFIVNGVSEEYLKVQTPNYWINWAIYQFTNQASNEFISFVENASENRVDVFKNTPIIVTTSISDTSDKGNELNLLLETDLNQFNDKSTWYYHTTDLISAESIFTNGISLAVGQIKQDFGSRTTSFYLNDEFKLVIDFGIQKFIGSPCVIIIYDIPKSLLKDYQHLDLSSGNKRWKDVVRKSRNFCKCEADVYDSVYSPQVTNYIRMIRNKYEMPKADINKNQLALKSSRLTSAVDLRIVGIIIYKKNKI
ncbi:unnamed protein product [Rhizophagus irregularis]|uniref:Uncharacterized protein n=1 Tax=Rhizophagus irregularis TaxID=588596 RepID=A0A2N1MYL6_9GLOM|nr:hypothetical protein RhiirC2_852675 [Rhizophagus irregularis]CAB4396217.1 unnamed protein product [Rhizophagus irregularis]CAB5359993.1 unnamed protein product [Rhizophagus irregularis]